MNSTKPVVLYLLVVVAALAACGGPAFPAQGPCTAVDVSRLTLVPYLDPILGLRSVVPEGWIEAYPQAYPGVFISGPPATRPSTTLLQRLEAGPTLGQAQAAWLQREGEQEFPDQVGSLDTAAFQWEL